MSPTRPTIALLLDYLVSSYQVSILRAIEHATQARAVNLLIVAGRSLNAPSVGDATQNRVYELLGPDNVDGVVLVSGCMSYSSGPAVLAEYCRRFAPVPVCSIGLALPGTPSLVVSNQHGSQLLVEHLIVRHGAQRIAYIAGPEANREAVDRHSGYLLALDRHGLARDDDLLARGDFSIPTGATAMRDVIARGVPFDAVVAANDYMAVGALDVLREHGLRVPQDVLLAGFDDAPFARFALPSLTTVRQPLERLGRTAVDWLMQAAQGAELPLTMEVEVDLVTRQSCGCGLYSARTFDSRPPSNTRADMARSLLGMRDLILRSLHDNLGIPPDALGGWAERLIDALHAELDGRQASFLAELGDVLEEAQSHPDFVDELAKVVSLLRAEVRRCRPPCDVALDLEQIWHQAQLAVGNAATNVQGRQKLDLQVVIDAVRVGFERIGTALSGPTLRQAVASMLPDVHIRRATIGLFGEGRTDQLVPFLIVAPDAVFTLPQDAHASPPQDPYPATRLVPPGFFPERRHSHIVLPLSFEQDWFGLIVMEYTTNETVYGLLRDNVSSALKSGSLHRAGLRQTATLERVEREHLEQEAKIASRIQTAILPHPTRVQGLAISARMVPAADVGGDYYDVIPVHDGCWIGIGDVTGHGLIAGLMMLMLQGMVASLVRKDPGASPTELVNVLNRSLHENIHHRLSRDDYATFVLLRYQQNGHLCFSGAHEEIIVYRAESGRCETVRAPGFWVGAIPEIDEMTSDTSLQLTRGDLLVLYTDGVTEAMNEHSELFGPVRLRAVIEASAHQPVEELSLRIVKEVEQWQSRQLDDITVLVARYDGASSSSEA